MKRDQISLNHLEYDINSDIKERALHLERKGRSIIGAFLSRCCRIRALRPIIFRILKHVEGGAMFSQSLRVILNKYFDVDVGMYSYGTCMRPGILPPGTKIGNYCSIADGFNVLRRNHPTYRLSQHPLFFNHKVGLIAEDNIHSIKDNPLVIGHDVWIGANVIIAPGCKIIGNGAVVAAGALVSSNVPPFAIVGGMPAKFIRTRFLANEQQLIEESQWWMRRIDELAQYLPLFEARMNDEVFLMLKKL